MKTVPVDFGLAFITFFKGCKAISDSNHATNYPSFCPPEFRFDQGSKYMRVWRGTSCFCFVNIKNGDVLKPASWKSPAKHARGNIYDSSNGLALMTAYGPPYLR